MCIEELKLHVYILVRIQRGIEAVCTCRLIYSYVSEEVQLEAVYLYVYIYSPTL